jgi:collagen beta-1,O-galactosyltransferase
MIIDKIFMINLERKKNIAEKSLNRLKNLTNINENNIFNDIVIYKAIDGQLLNLNDLDEDLTIKAKFTLEEPSSYDDIRSLGEIGCYLSHTNIWKEIIKNNYNNCIIFEDDVIPKKNYKKIIESIYNIPKNYDIAYLGWWSREKINNNEQTDWFSANNKNVCNVLGLYSYVISNEGAKKLLSKAFPIDVQLDTYVSLYNKVTKDLNRYLSKEQLFIADKTVFGESNTHTACNKCKFFNDMKYKYN